jgi:hypothetical protein
MTKHLKIIFGEGEFERYRACQSNVLSGLRRCEVWSESHEHESNLESSD